MNMLLARAVGQPDEGHDKPLIFVYELTQTHQPGNQRKRPRLKKPWVFCRFPLQFDIPSNTSSYLSLSPSLSRSDDCCGFGHAEGHQVKCKRAPTILDDGRSISCFGRTESRCFFQNIANCTKLCCWFVLRQRMREPTIKKVICW